jgi:glycerol-3-phosphate dehydrogenase
MLTDQSAMTQQREVNLLVAGAETEGMTAALVASLQKLRVLLCEKSDQVMRPCHR